MSLFQQIALRKPKRHYFNLSHEVKYTSSMGRLIPLYWEEVLPGDKFTIGIQNLTRLAPMLAPMMHRVNMRFYAFFVPNRLLYGQDVWENFITGGEDGSSETKLPCLKFGPSPLSKSQERLLDYLGYRSLLNTQNASSWGVSNMIAGPYLAYYKIWNEYFRDQNLQDEINVPFSGNGYDIVSQGLMYKCWEKDQFTSSLPWLQRGPQTLMPIAGKVSVSGALEDYPSGVSLKFEKTDGSRFDGTSSNAIFTGTDNGTIRELSDQNNSGSLRPKNLSDFLRIDGALGDLETSFSINDLRRAVKLQEWLEKNARGGARYTEQILSHFGVRSKDSRLQRPEFLGATSIPIQISEVLQTSSTTSDSPQANMAGHGISAGSNFVCKNRYFPEHGILMLIGCAVPRTGYYGGSDRRLYKPDRFSYYWPEFAHIGEQPVYKDEIDSKNAAPWSNPEVFGYQERYYEYKSRLSRVVGDFEDTLNFWHLDRTFTDPQLNGSFVQCLPRTDIFAVQNNDDAEPQYLWSDAYISVKASRLVSKYSIPQI